MIIEILIIGGGHGEQTFNDVLVVTFEQSWQKFPRYSSLHIVDQLLENVLAALN